MTDAPIEPDRLKSVFFFSLHKCATALFTHSVLPQSFERHHVDHQTAIYLNKTILTDVRSEGYVYGVLRIVEEQHPMFTVTQTIVETAKQQADCTKIILIRDPRDILVSMYFSFGFTHGVSPNLELRDYQQKRREQVQTMTIDEYALAESSTLKMKFNMLNELIAQSNSVVLRYEDLINQFDRFYNDLSFVLPMQSENRKTLFEKSRPNLVENPSAHKRSGKVLGCLEKLTKQTIQALDEEFADILRQFNYPALSRA